MCKLYLASVLCLSFLTVPAWSATGSELDSKFKTYEIRRLQDGESIKIDGQLTDLAWSSADVASDFLQQVPEEGKPATQKTEVRLLYDDKNIYVGFRCWQNHKIVVTDLHRDFAIVDNDVVEIVFDTFQDRRNGLAFVTSPMGALMDTQFSADGADANTNWNGVWDVRTHTYPDSWTAEFVIPFKTLRFKEVEEQQWGLNIMRRARYVNEGSCWSFVPRRFKVGMVSMAGTMVGLQNLRPGRNLKVKPFVSSTATHLSARPGKQDYYVTKPGLDVKFGVTPGLTLDFTANTDFSQVEADVQQSNLTRFGLFFPEKREFFLENSNLFTMGEVPFFGITDATLFYSRRIGLDPGGNPIPLLGGVRLSGHVNRYELGLLNMQSKEFGATPANNFTVARVRRSIFKNSDIGAMFENRQATSVEGNYNRVFGADTDLRFTKNLVLSGFLARSQTPNKSGKDWAGGATLNWSRQNLTGGLTYREVQPNFNADLGFMRRTDVRMVRGNFAWLFHPEGLFHIREIRPYIMTYNYLTTENKLDTRTSILGLDIDFHNGSWFSVWRTQTHEVLNRVFQPFPNRGIEMGEYRYSFYHVEYYHDSSKVVSPNFQYEQGEYYSGHRVKLGGGLKFHPNAKLSFTTSVERNNVDVPSGTYGINLMLWRINYSFSTRMFLDALVQYNSLTGQVSSNIRFNLIHHPLSDLFIVYNDNRDWRTSDVIGRVLSVKFTRLFDF